MLLSPARCRLLNVLPTIQLTIAGVRDVIYRKPLKVLNSQGDPYYPEEKPPSQEVPEVKELADGRKFNPGAYQDYLKKLSLHNLKRCKFDNRISYISIGSNHPDYVRARLIVKGRTKEKKNFIVLEGKNIIRDALNCGMKLNKLFFINEEIFKDLPELENVFKAAAKGEYADSGTVILQVSVGLMKGLTQVQTPPGLIGFFEKSHDEGSATRASSLPLTVIGDNIRDPGNMGTLIRSAAAVGVERIVCTKGCANPWDSKVVRSGAGAHFRVNLTTDFNWSDLSSELSPTNTTMLIAEKADYSSKSKTSNSLKVKNYYDIDYSPYAKGDKRLILVIGGETEGISDEALKVSESYENFKVSIPIMKGVDSLNSAVAGSIILFEIQRQIIKSTLASQ